MGLFFFYFFFTWVEELRFVWIKSYNQLLTLVTWCQLSCLHGNKADYPVGRTVRCSWKVWKKLVGGFFCQRFKCVVVRLSWITLFPLTKHNEESFFHHKKFYLKAGPNVLSPWHLHLCSQTYPVWKPPSIKPTCFVRFVMPTGRSSNLSN